MTHRHFLTISAHRCLKYWAVLPIVAVAITTAGAILIDSAWAFYQEDYAVQGTKFRGRDGVALLTSNDPKGLVGEPNIPSGVPNEHSASSPFPGANIPRYSHDGVGKMDVNTLTLSFLRLCPASISWSRHLATNFQTMAVNIENGVHAIYSQLANFHYIEFPPDAILKESRCE